MDLSLYRVAVADGDLHRFLLEGRTDDSCRCGNDRYFCVFVWLEAGCVRVARLRAVLNERTVLDWQPDRVVRYGEVVNEPINRAIGELENEGDALLVTDALARCRVPGSTFLTALCAAVSAGAGGDTGAVDKETKRFLTEAMKRGRDG
jgi:hypothetical protein